MAAVLVLLSAAIAVRKAARALNERRLAPVEAGIRPAIVRLLADEDGTDPGPTVRTRAERRVLAGLVSDYLAKVRGEARQTLVALLEREGVVAADRKRAL